MKHFIKQEFDLATIQAQVFSGQQSIRLVMDDVLLDRLIIGKDPAIRNFMMRRLKLLFDRCSKAVKEGKIPVEVVNRLSTFCLEIIPLIESEKIMMPTATELRILFDWYLNKQAQSKQKPAVILTTVCPDIRSADCPRPSARCSPRGSRTTPPAAVR